MHLQDRLRCVALTGLVALIAVALHYAAWLGTGTPRTLHLEAHTPRVAAAGGVLLCTAAVLAWRARSARVPQTVLARTLPEDGLVPFSIGFALAAEATMFLPGALGAPVNIHVNALAVAVAACGAPFFLWLAIPARAPVPDSWEEVLRQAEVQAANLTTEHAPSSEPPACIRRVPNPGVTYADVIGLDDSKRDVTEAIHLMDHPEIAKAHGLEPVRGILLHGPPGTGKTHFARATAGQFGRRFLEVKASELVSQYVGETEKNIAAAFDYARKTGPAILFIDEVDSLASNRAHARNDWEVSRVNALLAEMDGLTQHPTAPILIAATNRLDDLDPAILRPGRFDRQVLVGLPSAGDRVRLLQLLLRGTQLGPDVDLKDVAGQTEGWSPADLKALVQDARRRIFREGNDSPRPMTRADLHMHLGRRRSRATPRTLSSPATC